MAAKVSQPSIHPAAAAGICLCVILQNLPEARQHIFIFKPLLHQVRCTAWSGYIQTSRKAGMQQLCKMHGGSHPDMPCCLLSTCATIPHTE